MYTCIYLYIGHNFDVISLDMMDECGADSGLGL